MRSPCVFFALLLAACATTGGASRPGDSRDATAAVDALVRGDHAAALADADRGLAKRPDDPWLLYDRGAALAGLGKTDEAVATLRRAEQRFPDRRGRALAVYRRALALERAGRCPEAATEYSRYAALVRDRDPALAHDALTHLYYCISPNAGRLAGRDDAARLRIAARDAERRAADERSTASARALAAGNDQAALDEADTGLAIAPHDPWLLYDRGAALAGLDRTDEALAALGGAELAFRADDVHGRSAATYRRALALEAAGRCREEQAELAHFAALTGESQEAQSQHARLRLRFCKLAAANRAVY